MIVRVRPELPSQQTLQNFPTFDDDHSTNTQNIQPHMVRPCCQVINDRSIAFAEENAPKQKEFVFDHVLNETTSQDQVFFLSLV